MPKRDRRPASLLRPGQMPKGTSTRRRGDNYVMRVIVGMMGAPEVCDYAPCRRRKECSSATAECFDTNIEKVREFLNRLADWPRLDGPRDEDELDAPVTAEELLD